MFLSRGAAIGSVIFSGVADVPEGPIGESWELVDLPEHQSTVLDGERAGQTLGDLWRDGVLGGAQGSFRFFEVVGCSRLAKCTGSSRCSVL